MWKNVVSERVIESECMSECKRQHTVIEQRATIFRGMKGVDQHRALSH